LKLHFIQEYWEQSSSDCFAIGSQRNKFTQTHVRLSFALWTVVRSQNRKPQASFPPRSIVPVT
jgi:hypothetical protein